MISRFLFYAEEFEQITMDEKTVSRKWRDPFSYLRGLNPLTVTWLVVTTMLVAMFLIYVAFGMTI
jgi:hypothetical protein